MAFLILGVLVLALIVLVRAMFNGSIKPEPLPSEHPRKKLGEHQVVDAPCFRCAGVGCPLCS